MGKKRDLEILCKKIDQLEERLRRLEENEIPHLNLQINDAFINASKNIEDNIYRIDELVQWVNKHKEEHEVKRQALGERIYALHKSELEKEHLDKIVALDIESSAIAGIGNTVTEAYHQAREKFGEKQYYFKRVGRKYLYKLR